MRPLFAKGGKVFGRVSIFFPQIPTVRNLLVRHHITAHLYRYRIYRNAQQPDQGISHLRERRD